LSGRKGDLPKGKKGRRGHVATMVTGVWGEEVCHDSTGGKQSGIRVGVVEKERN
jgi:hypothetical protein